MNGGFPREIAHFLTFEAIKKTFILRGNTVNKKIVTTFLSATLVICTGMASGALAADAELKAFPTDTLHVPSEGIQKGSAPETSIYIVQLEGDPVIAYEGAMKGYQPTRPGKGRKLNPNSAHVKKYATYLEARQNEVIKSVGGDKVYSYVYGINGFAARMTRADAEALKARADVINVWQDEIRQLQTDTSPAYIGLTEGGEAWSKGLTGNGVVIGILDTGIWPEHPSFSDVPTPKKGNKGPLTPYSAPYAFTPSGCNFGNTAANPLDAAASCNNKLVAARCYNLGFSAASDPSNPCGGDGAFTIPTEFQSARDNDGHGSHTASTAGGNYGVAAEIGGNPLGTVSGIAPRAHISAYKVCWNGSNPPSGFSGGCASSDSAAAIDQAVADGVDVINFSIGGASTSFGGPDDIAFLFAADPGGVWVATSNGNSGPGAETVGTPAGVPWITAVGANQDDGVFGLVVGVNSPASIAGDKEALEGNGPVSLTDSGVISGDVTLTNPANGCAALAAPISGIALTIRGACSFSDKYNNAAAAGASAIIVYNDGTTPDRIDPITMSAPGTTIPGVMVSFNDGDDMAGESGVTATLDPANLLSRENRVAGFSSRGPNGGAPDIIKPDISAPGVSILAAQTPIPNDGQTPGQLFQVISGTSMSSPHVAGAFALLKQARGNWSAAQARSALMTTARQDLKKTFGEDAATPFDIGAGEILPTDARDPGLSYDAGLFEYAAFSCGNNFQIFTQGSCDFLASIGLSFDGSELNLPSIGIGELAGTQTVTRTVTSVARNNGNLSYTVSVDSPPGIDVSVNPTTIKLKNGESASYEVTFTSTSGAVLDEWAFGSLTWSHAAKYSVRSPIAVRPVAFGAPDSVSGSGTAGSLSFDIGFGYDGDYTAGTHGLVPAVENAGNVVDDPANDINVALGSGVGVTFEFVTVPAGSDFARFALFDEDTDGNDDLDLYVFGPDTAGFPFVGSSGSPTSAETVDIIGPAPGTYIAVVHGWQTDGPDANYVLSSWAFGPDVGNMTVTAPTSASAGASDTVTVDWGGLAAGMKYLGAVSHSDAGGLLDLTLVNISTE